MKQIVKAVKATSVHMDTAVDGIDMAEIEETFENVPSYGFKTRKARFCCALCRRMEKHRGYRCGDK